MAMMQHKLLLDNIIMYILNRIWWTIKGIFGFHTIGDGSTCWFSLRFWDVHSWQKEKGGTGDCNSFRYYECEKCKSGYVI